MPDSERPYQDAIEAAQQETGVGASEPVDDEHNQVPVDPTAQTEFKQPDDQNFESGSEPRLDEAASVHYSKSRKAAFGFGAALTASTAAVEYALGPGRWAVENPRLGAVAVCGVIGAVSAFEHSRPNPMQDKIDDGRNIGGKLRKLKVIGKPLLSMIRHPVVTAEVAVAAASLTYTAFHVPEIVDSFSNKPDWPAGLHGSQTVEVHAGDTLTGLVVDNVSGLDPANQRSVANAVEAVCEQNDLGDNCVIHPGSELELPDRKGPKNDEDSLRQINTDLAQYGAQVVF